jgi:hypothetical protein
MSPSPTVFIGILVVLTGITIGLLLFRMNLSGRARQLRLASLVFLLAGILIAVGVLVLELS